MINCSYEKIINVAFLKRIEDPENAAMKVFIVITDHSIFHFQETFSSVLYAFVNLTCNLNFSQKERLSFHQ